MSSFLRHSYLRIDLHLRSVPSLVLIYLPIIPKLQIISVSYARQTLRRRSRIINIPCMVYLNCNPLIIPSIILFSTNDFSEIIRAYEK
jgi:hypothetical protein